MHAIEKILARNAGVESVKTGEIVYARVDFAEINDLYLQTVYSFYEMGGDKVWDKSRVAFCFDHYAPAPTIKTASNHNEMREFARKNDLTYHFDVDCGVCHQVMAEAGVVYPGMILVATDSHTTTHGAFGSLGTGCGATDMACILMTGEMWFRVPEIIEVRLEGQPQKGVYPKDVILTVLGKIKADGAVYKCIDFTGSYVDALDVSGRMTICNPIRRFWTMWQSVLSVPTRLCIRIRILFMQKAMSLMSAQWNLWSPVPMMWTMSTPFRKLRPRRSL